MTTTKLRRRRLATAAAAVAAFSALSACGSETTVGAPAPAASATPTPGSLEGFCSTIMAIDTAAAQLGGGGEEDSDPAAAPSAEPTADASAEPAADAPSPAAGPAFTASSVVPQDGEEPDPTAAPDSSTTPGSSTAEPFVYGSDAKGTDATGDESGLDSSGSDEGDFATAKPSATAPPANGPSAAELAEARAAFTPLIAELERNRQAEVGESIDTMVRLAREALSTGNFELFEADDMNAADAKVDTFMLDKCGYEHISLTGSDFEFTGVPAKAKAGPTGVTLINEGEEMHVAVVMRFNDGVTTSVDDLLKMSEAESMKLVTVVGETFAMPGAKSTDFFELKPGRYAVICPIPEGSKPGQEGDGAPHFAEGMFDDFTVA